MKTQNLDKGKFIHSNVQTALVDDMDSNQTVKETEKTKEEADNQKVRDVFLFAIALDSDRF